MGHLPTYDSLRAKFSRAESLPEMPTAAVRLSNMLDSGEATNVEIERVILGDPNLTAGVLRAASNAAYGYGTRPVTTVRAALLVLGHKALRSVVVSIWMQAIAADHLANSPLRPDRFAQHSMVVGFLSRYLFAVRQRKGGLTTNLTPDELFSIGVLHDVGAGLLAVVEPKAFRRVLVDVETRPQPFEAAFEKAFGGSLGVLGANALTAWRLPSSFGELIACVRTPAIHPTESVAAACIHYADALATEHGYGLLTTKCPWTCDPFAEAEVGLPQEDIAAVMELVAAHTEAYAPKQAA